jgi:hypothetical protein
VVWVWYTLVFDHLARASWLAWSFARGRWAAAAYPSAGGSMSSG